MPHRGLQRLARQVSFCDARRHADLLLNLRKRLFAAIDPRTREALIEAMGRALDAVTASDAWGFFEYRGYRPLDQPL